MGYTNNGRIEMKVTREEVDQAEAEWVAAWKAYDALNAAHAKAAANARDKIYIAEDKLFHLKGEYENGN